PSTAWPATSPLSNPLLLALAGGHRGVDLLLAPRGHRRAFPALAPLELPVVRHRQLPAVLGVDVPAARRVRAHRDQHLHLAHVGRNRLELVLTETGLGGGAGGGA